MGINLLLPKLLEGITKPYRYKVIYGGRGSAKSWSISRLLLVFALKNPLLVLCTRELQRSIQDSVHRVLSDQIDLLNLSRFYTIKQTKIENVRGSEFIFEGIRFNTNKIKSMEGVDICWVEEAEKVSERSWEILIPTIRKDNSEIWISFNPDQETDPTFQRFVKNPPPGSWVQKVNFYDNPWFPKELRKEKDYLMRVDPVAAAHVWRGELRTNSDAQILAGKYIIESFEPGADWDGPYFGADWGFAIDPTVLVKMWIHQNKLYIEHEAYGIGVDIDKTPQLFDRIPGAVKYTIRADSARPETISYLQRNGYPKVEGAGKWKGSVEDGIAHLRAYETIVIHSRCIHAQEEARLWSYKKDRLTDDILPEVADGNEHVWDAARYGLQPLIKRSGFGMLDYYRQLCEEQKPEESRSEQ